MFEVACIGVTAFLAGAFF
jgi:hypothetical protein